MPQGRTGVLLSWQVEGYSSWALYQNPGAPTTPPPPHSHTHTPLPNDYTPPNSGAMSKTDRLDKAKEKKLCGKKVNRLKNGSHWLRVKNHYSHCSEWQTKEDLKKKVHKMITLNPLCGLSCLYLLEWTQHLHTLRFFFVPEGFFFIQISEAPVKLASAINERCV